MLLKVGIPYTLIGMVVVSLGLFLLERLFAGSDHLMTILFVWLGVFWAIYQPLFRQKMRKFSRQEGGQT